MRPVADGADRDRGSVTPLVVGFALVVLMLVAVVVDASAAYLERQSLATLAEGAALQGADLGAEGAEVYADGIGDEPLQVTASRARAAVGDYLADVGAYRDHPGLDYAVVVDGARVVVRLTARVELPLSLPGAPRQATVSAEGAAIADPVLPGG